MKLIITRGLPGSGKTTWAREWVAADRLRRARVNRDTFRAMLHDGVFIKGDANGAGTEKVILAARDATISALLKLGLDVVCDDTNLPNRTVRDLRRLAAVAGADFEIRDMTDVPVEVCVERDAARERTVGREVIERQWLRFVKGKPHPLPIADEPEAGPAAVVPYTPKPGTEPTVLVDIDGTVALMGNRSPYDDTRVHEDRPNAPVIAAVRAMAAAGHTVVFCSGRTDTCRDATEKWLAEHVGVPYAALHMRVAGDSRKDSVVKAEIFDRHIRDHYNVIAVFDDRNQVVEMWRARGLTVLQVAEGNF